MYVDVKVSVWQRIKLHRGTTPEEVIELLKRETPHAIWDELDAVAEIETLNETELYSEPKEGSATIQVFDDDEQLVWTNAS